jgi:hypothetical protein
MDEARMENPLKRITRFSRAGRRKVSETNTKACESLAKESEA